MFLFWQCRLPSAKVMWSFGGVDGDGSCFGLLAYHFDKAPRQEATEIMPPLLCLDRFVMVVQSRSLLSYLGRRFDRSIPVTVPIFRRLLTVLYSINHPGRRGDVRAQ